MSREKNLSVRTNGKGRENKTVLLKPLPATGMTKRIRQMYYVAFALRHVGLRMNLNMVKVIKMKRKEQLNMMFHTCQSV
jgi:hypothetical protein